MNSKMKHELDKSIPTHITLSEAQKHKIMTAAEQHLYGNKPFRKLMLKPIFTTFILATLILFLGFPFIQSEIEKLAFLQKLEEEALEKVVIDHVDFDDLNHSIYLDETKEIIYTDSKGIYAFSTKSHQKTTLVEPSTNVQIYQYTANENWVIWEDMNTSKMMILNRITGSTKNFSNDSMSDFHLAGDQFLYLSLSGKESDPGYYVMDLHSFKTKKIHELTGQGAESKASVEEGLIAIPEKFKNENGIFHKIFVYHLDSKKLWYEYEVPYEYVRNITIDDNKIYALFTNDLTKPQLGYLEFSKFSNEESVHKLNTPPFNEFAVYKEYLALSIPKGNSDTVKMFQLENNEVKPLQTLNQIKERLILPRYTQAGTLVLNGEGKKPMMYLLNVNHITELSFEFKPVISKLTDEEFRSVGTSEVEGATKGDFRKFTLTFNINHGDYVQSRDVETPSIDWRVLMNSIDGTSRYWFGNGYEQNNDGEDFSLYYHEFIFYSNGLSEQEIRDVFNEVEFSARIRMKDEIVENKYNVGELLEIK